MFSSLYFISLSPFTPSSNHGEHQQSRFERSTEDRSYLLTRLFARHLLPSDSVLQGFTDWQPQHPLLHELVMRFYITRYRVQGDSQRWRSLTTGWSGDRWRNRNRYWTLQPWGDISRCRQWLLIKIHWGQGPLETSENMLGTLQAVDQCTYYVSAKNISSTFEM